MIGALLVAGQVLVGGLLLTGGWVVIATLITTRHRS